MDTDIHLMKHTSPRTKSGFTIRNVLKHCPKTSAIYHQPKYLSSTSLISHRHDNVSNISYRRLKCRSLSINVSSNADDDPPSSPSHLVRQRFQTIAKFVLPVLLVPLADPLMSLIDTIALGRMTTSIQVAALGCCSLIFNTCNYGMAALSVSTITLAAERIAQGQYDRASNIITAALVIATTVGVAVATIIVTNGPQLIAATGANELVRAPAETYLKIRALSIPAALIVQVSQAALLSQKNSRDPFRIVIMTSIVSLLGDLLFIGELGLGVAGAAMTTVAAQWLQATLALRALIKSKVPPTPRSKPLPEDLLALAKTFAILGLFYISKNLSHLAIQATAARILPTPLAAHQAMWSTWNIASFLNSPMEQAALAFIPETHAQSAERWATCMVVLLLGGINWLAGCGWAILVPALFPHLLIADAGAWPLMRQVAPLGTLALFFACLDVCLTGCLLATKDSAYVAGSMILSGIGLVGYFISTGAWGINIGNGFLAGGNGGVVAGGSNGLLNVVWWGLVVFFGLRAFFSCSRVVQKGIMKFSSSDKGSDSDSNSIENDDT